MNDQRISRLEEVLAEIEIMSAVLERPEHLRYFAAAEYGALVIGDGPPRTVSTPDELPSGLTGPVGVDQTDGGFATALLAERRDVTAAVAAIRRAKDVAELQQISAAMGLVDRALAACHAAVAAGTSDVVIWQAANGVCASCEGELDGDVGVAPAACGPDAPPRGHTLSPGAHVFVDLYPRLHGYFGDASRVYCAGRADDMQCRVHAALWDAVDRVSASLRPGANCGDLDALCRQTLAARNLDGRFPHHTGHGIGLLQQEAPMIAPGSSDVLVEGDVVAIEPGFYLQGWGGMRVEDSFLVSAHGAVPLTHADRRLEVSA